MTGTLQRLAIAAALALACAVAPADAAPKKARVQQGYSAGAQQILARARQASGGAGWSLLRGWHETGHIGGPGGSQAYESWFDTLRYGSRIETHGPEGVTVRGFNGQGAWRIAPSGVSTPIDDRAQAAEMRTEAFLGGGGVFYTSRFDAHGEIVGTRTLRGRTFDLINVQPWSGAPRELWFDRATHLLTRIVDRTTGQPVITELSDYRKVGPIRVAFHAHTEGAGPPQDRQVDTVAFIPADRALFSLPRTP
ncbi:MAG: hypothetical protein ABIU07_06640 [Ramlibacter sp.]